jgi:hypothetical protein
VETVGALEDLYGDQYVAIGRHWQPKERMQGDGGPRNELSATCRWLACCAIPALCKGCSHKGLMVEKRQ